MLGRNLLVSLLIVYVISVEEKPKDTLILVHAVVRHGDRTPDPLSAYPKNINKNHTYFPHGPAELNKKGLQRIFQAGKQLRERYDEFLGPIYYPEMVEAKSSGYSRCRMSMQILLAAIFPPDPSQAFLKGLPWQPIAYEYLDTKVDPMMTFLPYMKDLNAMVPIEGIEKCENRDFLNRYLTEHTGLEVRTMLSVFFLHDGLKVEVENGLTLPDWTKTIWKEPLRTCAYDLWRHLRRNKQLLAKVGGLFVEKIITDTYKNIRNSSRKLYLYSGHDFNIFVFLGVLEYYEEVQPIYGTYLLFEVHKINDTHGVKIFLENHDGFGLRQLEIPGCGMFCPIDTFYEKMKMYINTTINP